jgi:hypothetical protein
LPREKGADYKARSARTWPGTIASSVTSALPAWSPRFHEAQTQLALNLIPKRMAGFLKSYPKALAEGVAVDLGGVPALAGAVAQTIADVGALVADIESDGKGVPVLLRQYLKLNARLLGFNVDESFGGVLDGLMMVDLMDVAPDVLARYMGKAGARAFVAHHASETSRLAS